MKNWMQLSLLILVMMGSKQILQLVMRSLPPVEHLAEAPVLHSVGTFQEEAPSTTEEAEEASEELLEASTVEDVMPSIDEIAEQQAPTLGKPVFAGKSLFGNK